MTTQLTLHYPDTPGYKRNGTSREAANAVADTAPKMRDRILALLRIRPRSADECAESLGASILYVRPRLSELARAGRIAPTGNRVRNASGKAAMTWRAVM